MNSKEYKFTDGRTAVFEYDENGIGKITLECMDVLMGMITPQWIPCSERLPKPYASVLVCSDIGNIEISHGDVFDSTGEFEWFPSGWKFGNVVAWMPLPEPYKGE